MYALITQQKTQKGGAMRKTDIKEKLLRNGLYMCVECYNCHTLIPLALALNNDMKTISDTKMAFESTCYFCNHKQSYLAGQAHLFRAKNKVLQAQ